VNTTSWRRSGFGSDFRFDAASRQKAVHGTLLVLSFCLFMLLVQRFDAPPVLAGALLLMAAIPLVLWPELATPLTFFLLYVNFPAILTKQHGLPEVVAGAFILLLAFPLAYYLVIRRERLRVDRTFLGMLGFLIVLLASSFLAVDQNVALGRVLSFTLEGLLVFWLIINVVRNRRVLRRAIWSLLAAGSLLASLSLYQELTGSYEQEFGGLAYRNFEIPPGDLDREGPVRRQGWHRAQGPVDQANRFGQILIVLLPLAVLSYRTEPSRRGRMWAAVGGLLILGGIGVTLSRGAFVNVVLLAVAMTALKWIRPRHLLLCLTLLLVSIPIVTPYYIPRMLSIANAKYLTADDPAHRNNADGAIRGRTTSMLTALHVFRDHPILGVGPGQFRFYYAEYSDNPEVKFRDNRGQVRRAHNLYLEIAAETGVIGLTVFMGIILVLMRGLWRMRRRFQYRDPGLADLATAFWLSLFAYLGTGMFAHLSFQRYFWFLLAVASAALHLIQSQRSTSTATRAETMLPRPLPRGSR
jgi:putative inorganic carbon (hco3(-)) transporter